MEGPVALHTDYGIGRGPKFAGFVDGHNPDEVVLLRIVDQGQREAVAFSDNVHGDRRIELGNYIHDTLTSGGLAYLSGRTHGALAHVMRPRTIPRPVQDDLRSGDITIKDASARA